jgi:hypothetical protein
VSRLVGDTLPRVAHRLQIGEVLSREGDARAGRLDGVLRLRGDAHVGVGDDAGVVVAPLLEEAHAAEDAVGHEAKPGALHHVLESSLQRSVLHVGGEELGENVVEPELLCHVGEAGLVRVEDREVRRGASHGEAGDLPRKRAPRGAGSTRLAERAGHERGTAKDTHGAQDGDEAGEELRGSAGEPAGRSLGVVHVGEHLVEVDAGVDEPTEVNRRLHGVDPGVPHASDDLSSDVPQRAEEASAVVGRVFVGADGGTLVGVCLLPSGERATTPLKLRQFCGADLLLPQIDLFALAADFRCVRQIEVVVEGHEGLLLLFGEEGSLPLEEVDVLGILVGEPLQLTRRRSADNVSSEAHEATVPA